MQQLWENAELVEDRNMVKDRVAQPTAFVNRTLGNLTSFLPLDMEQDGGCNLCNFARCLEAVISSK